MPTDPSQPDLAQHTRHPIVELLLIAMPTVVTMTSYTVMQFIDGLMVSRIGSEPMYVAAQGNGAVFTWLFLAGIVGLLSVINTFVSQHLGAGTPRRGAAYAWNGMWLSALMWLVVVVPAIWLTPQIFGVIVDLGERVGGERGQSLDPRQVTYQIEYARISMIGGLFLLLARALGHYFFGMHRPVVVMVSALAGNVVNFGANYVLIFGKLAEWGIADIGPLGVKGAAIGTAIGSFIELVIPLAVFLSAKWANEYSTREPWRWAPGPVKDILRIGWPAALMTANEIVCWSYLMSVLLPAAGRAAGDDPTIHNTAGWIALRYMHLAFMPAIGISIAVTAMVGRAMGMRRPDLAAQRTWLALGLCMGYMGVWAVVFFSFRHWLVGWFIPPSMSPEQAAQIIEVGSKVMIAAAIFQLFDALAITMSGALRGAGDTVWPGVATTLLSWAGILGVGHLLIYLRPDLGSLGPWIGATSYLIALGIILCYRFLRGRWREIELVDGPEPGATTAELVAAESAGGPT